MDLDLFFIKLKITQTKKKGDKLKTKCIKEISKSKIYTIIVFDKMKTIQIKIILIKARLITALKILIYVETCKQICIYMLNIICLILVFFFQKGFITFY